MPRHLNQLMICLVTILFLQSSIASNPYHEKAITIQLRHSILKIKKQFHINALSFAIKLPHAQKPVIINLGTTQKDHHISITENNLFQVGSITKTFTAVLIAKAITQHKIKLTDTIGKFFPCYKKWKNITIAQLLTQTTGIADYDQTKGFWRNLVTHPHKVWSAKTLMNMAYALPENFKAGESWRYSNTNYVLLGMIVSKVEKVSINQLMKNLFQTSNLNNIYFINKNFSNAMLKRMVHGYHGKYDQTQLNTSWLQADGAIISTPTVLVNWMHQLFNKNLMLPVTHFVSTATGKPTNSLANTAYSAGLFRMNTPEGLVYFTPGLTPGYTSMMAYAPCLNIYFSYSASNGMMIGFHKKMMMTIMRIVKENLNKKNFNMPQYCKAIHPSKVFIFPMMR